MGFKTRVEGSPNQIGNVYKEDQKAYPYGARRRGSGRALPPQTRSVDSMKMPVPQSWKKDYGTVRAWKHGDSYIHINKISSGDAFRKRIYAEGYRYEIASNEFGTSHHKSLKDAEAYAKTLREKWLLPKGYEEITFGVESMTAAQKRKAVMESEEFHIWLSERVKTHPVPGDPYRAFMIDRSLKAELKSKPEWAQRTNVSDYQPIDFPPSVKGEIPSLKPAPKTKEAEKTKAALRARCKLIAETWGIPEPELRFTTSKYGRARSFYSSGYAINKVTGEVIKAKPPTIVVGVAKHGKLKAENYAVLAHEMGHHRNVVELEKSAGQKAVIAHYKHISKSKKAKIDNERLAWKYAEPFMKDKASVQKWINKYALGTYLGTVTKQVVVTQ